MSYCSPVIGPCGTVFPSQAAACRAFGISKTTLRYHLDTHGNLSRFGMGKSRPGCANAKKPLTIGGATWPSRMEAAEALGISYSQIRRWASPSATPAMREQLAAAVMRWLALRDAPALFERDMVDVEQGATKNSMLREQKAKILGDESRSK